MDIKCIALDMDCTTLNNSGVLSPANRAALEYAISKGVEVIVASGRPYDSLPEDVLSIPGIRYAITANGAAVYYLPTGERIRRDTVPGDAIREVIRLTEHEPITMEFFMEGHAYADAAMLRDPAAYGIVPNIVKYIRESRISVDDIRSFALANADNMDSLNLVVPHSEDKARIWKMVDEKVQGIYTTTSCPSSIEISCKGMGKHSGLRFIADILGISASETATFGDNDNDADMLRWARCGIAVENATPGCKAAADHITLANDKDGVAWAIYNILKL